MELIAAIEDESVATRILTHLGLPARAPPRGRPWRRQLALGDRNPTEADVDGVDVPAYAE